MQVSTRGIQDFQHRDADSDIPYINHDPKKKTDHKAKKSCVRGLSASMASGSRPLVR